MPRFRHLNSLFLIAITLGCTGILLSGKMGFTPPPANDDCANATVIDISGGGFDYGNYTSAASDVAMATIQAGEFLQFAPGHIKSVWFTFTIPTRRSARIEVVATAGVIPAPSDAGVTVYVSNTCLPASSSKLGAFISSGDLTNPCLEPGTYHIQVTGSAVLNATLLVNLTLGCPDHPVDSKYDCPTTAYLFNSGLPLGASSATDPHNIECQSIEDPSEYGCLTVANKDLFLKSSWYVFTTGSNLNYLDFYFPATNALDEVGYQLLEGNVITSLPSTLTLIECGTAKARFSTRFIEFPCILKPNTTYSLVLIFHRDFSYNNLRLNVRQRGVSATGWPRPVLPPLIASNELGVLPASLPPGSMSTWSDRFDCSSFIINNVCPPANPAAGTVVVGTGNTAKTYDLATWATFTLTEDANVEFRFSAYQSSADYYTRIFSRHLTGSCPSPNLTSDLYLEYPGHIWLEKCMPAGDYSIQILSSSDNALPPNGVHEDSWTNGTMGTEFTLGFNVTTLASLGLFRLDAPGNFDAVNNLNPLQENVTYASNPSVFICENTVVPGVGDCTDDKVIYREVNIGDSNGDGSLDDGLLCMSDLRTDIKAAPPIKYGFYKGDANQLATAANTHNEGQLIPGMTDVAGYCITEDDDTLTLNGLPNFCACVRAGTYTLASFGNVDNVSKGDAPKFKFNTYKTIHDTRLNAELITVGPNFGAYSSGGDYFSCQDNRGAMPPCGGRDKLIFREFYLDSPQVTIITEIGNNSSVLSLFRGRASDLSSSLSLVEGCFTSFLFYDFCTKLEAGWYTVVSYGYGPNYTDKQVLDDVGRPGDVGLISRVNIVLIPVITPNFNRPYKAYQGGITDWFTPPPAFPNALTARLYQFANDTFCDPDTPFIPTQLAPCSPVYNRISMYVFEITKPSFVQIRNLAQTYFTAIYPFDVNADSASLLTVPPVYPCVAMPGGYRQICDLPPGKYTIAIFANDSHKSMVISPQIYVEAAAESRFDHAWNAYDFDVIPRTNSFVNGRAFDTHPFLPGQPPSRDVFYCTTGATVIDPGETKCEAQYNPLIYAQPSGVPKPQFLQTVPSQPRAQPWRNLWYTFTLTGSGICTLKTEVLGGSIYKPLYAVYESPADVDNIPWATLQSTLMTPGNTIIPGLTLIKDHIDNACDADINDLIFKKSGCIRDSVRYYLVVSFETVVIPYPTGYPNQTISVSVKYDPRPTLPAPYDERLTANVVNGLGETAPPYTSVQLTPGTTMIGPDFSLLCYTANPTDPPGCDWTRTRKSAWFKFEVATTGHFFGALEEIGGPNGWFANIMDLSIWKEASPGSPLELMTMDSTNSSGHDWIDGCIDRGTYYLLVRECLRIDTIQPYRVVIKLEDSAGDFCYNAIPVNVVNTTPVTGTTLVDCHTIGTDVGEFLPVGNTCFNIPGRKTTWFHAIVNAGPMVDLNFQVGENFTTNVISLNDIAYRILAGTCGAMTPIVCSSIGTNVITLNCLGPGDYYIQVSMPEKTGPGNSPEVKGSVSLTITANAADPLVCTEPVDPNQVLADFIFNSDCQSISLINLSTAGTDITYLWEFPDTTSVDVNPVWTPPGSGTFPVTLTVTNTALGTSDTFTLSVTVNNPFGTLAPLADTTICNDAGNVELNATIPGATYEWDNGTTAPTRVATTAGTYWVVIRKDGCERTDTVEVNSIDAQRNIDPTICPETSIDVAGEIFDISHPSGTVIIPNAHASGCDSLLHVSLSFYPSAQSQLDENICFGETYFFANQDLSQAGTYMDQLISQFGCDSIVTLDLAVTPRQISDQDTSGCTGSTIQLSASVSGVSYEWESGEISKTLDVSSAGSYAVSVTDANDCIISEETFNVTFGDLQVPTASIPPFICPGEDVLLTATGSSGDYQWFDAAVGGNLLGTGSTLLLQDVVVDDTIYVSAYEPGIDNCVSLRESVPFTLEDDAIQVALDTIVCAGSSVTLPWGELVIPVINTSYSFAYQNVESGCDSLELTFGVSLINLPPLTLPTSFILQLGDSVLLVPQIDFIFDSIQWTPAAGLSCTDCLQPWAFPEQSTDYEVTVWSVDGCLTKAIISIEVRRDVKIYIPNVFSPNNDGTNELFTVFGNREVQQVNRLLVYDRWGEAVWQGENFPADGSVGWDGLFWGKPMLSGVYAWICEIQLVDGKREMLAGDVTLLR